MLTIVVLGVEIRRCFILPGYLGLQAVNEHGVNQIDNLATKPPYEGRILPAKFFRLAKKLLIYKVGCLLNPEPESSSLQHNTLALYCPQQTC